MKKKLFDKKSKLNLPNLLTILRMILVIPFIVLMSLVAIELLIHNKEHVLDYNEMNSTTIYFIISGVIFAFAMFTDYLDGYLARKYDLISNFGKLFDPLADKWMTTSAFIFFSINGLIPFWVVILFVLRDLLVDASKNVAATNSIKVSASFLGKLKTVLQTLSILVIFIIMPFRFEEYSMEWWLIQIPVFVALVISLVSGAEYYKKISKYL